MSDDNSYRLDNLLYFGASAGFAKFRRSSELDPYETDYSEFELHLGIEAVRLFQFPFLFDTKLQSDLIVEAQYSYTGGDEINLGSHRHLLSGKVGLRTRFFLVRQFSIFLDTMGGIGWSHSELNFGKGFPLPKDDVGNVLGQLKGGIEICFGGNVCLVPNISTIWDFSFAAKQDYIHGNVIFGLDIFFKPKEEEEKKEEPAREIKETLAEAPPPLIKYVIVEGPSPPPIIQKVKWTRTKVIEKMTWFELPLTFSNDNPDILLQPQWFAEQNGGRMYECYSNPQLDHFMRTVYKWFKRVNPDGKDDYRMIIRVKAYANDTGTPKHNRELVLGRSHAVIDYLVADKKGEVYQSKIKGMKSIDSEERLREVGSDAQRKICGFQDSHGGRVGSLKELAGKGDVEIINENEELIKKHPEHDPIMDITDEFKVHISDASDPSYRTVRFGIQLLRNGLHLENIEMDKFIKMIQLSRD